MEHRQCEAQRAVGGGGLHRCQGRRWVPFCPYVCPVLYLCEAQFRGQPGGERRNVFIDLPWLDLDSRKLSVTSPCFILLWLCCEAGSSLIWRLTCPLAALSL